MRIKTLSSQLLCLVLLLFSLPAHAESADPFEGLYLNELMASNKNYFTTKYDTTPDWIKLWNSSSSDMDLSGLWLSDSKKHLDKFCFPEGTILKAGEYLVLHATGMDGVADGVIQLPFKLSSSGETVYLYQTGRLIDAVKYPELGVDASYARTETGELVVTDTPTIGAANEVPAAKD